MSELASRFDLSEFELGGLKIRPRERHIRSATATLTVEPLVMELLMVLSRRAGQLVSRREIFEVCWGEAPVGDDSLNRVVAILRKTLTRAAGANIRVETVPSAGYVLRLEGNSSGNGSSADAQEAIEAATHSWRMGLPEPDYLRLESLRRACAVEPGNARAWGMLALLARHAVEYGEAEATPEYVRECEQAATRATALDPLQPEALTAMACVAPLFGRWTDGRRRLSAILQDSPNCVAATEELAVLEMATGRIRASIGLRAPLIAADPLAALYGHKAIYQLWSVGDFTEMDHVADRAIQLWPTHPAVWMARLWTLAYTGRIQAALDMIEDATLRPRMPEPAIGYLRSVLGASEHGGSVQKGRAVEASRKTALTGPANALAAIFGLGLLDRPDDAFAVADGYYLRAGSGPVPVRHTQAEPSVNEQHRRLTQILFTPVFAKLRPDRRFLQLCERIGLCRYWDQNALNPDFMIPDAVDASARL